MKNNRKIEVGQVRMVNDERDSRFGSLYCILVQCTITYGKGVTKGGFKIKFIDGWSEGETTEWTEDIIAEDVIVM